MKYKGLGPAGRRARPKSFISKGLRQNAPQTSCQTFSVVSDCILAVGRYNRGMIEITRASILDGVERTIEIPLTATQYEVALYDWENGALIQDAFPTLTPGQREFIKSGITEEQWTETFADYDD